MTLTETATITKRFLRVFLIFGGAFLILWIAFLYIYNNIVIPYQRSQVKPENRFGALPNPSYPPTLLSSASLTYSLDTNSGNLPTDIPKLISIYFIPQSETTLLSPDRARTLATSLGFKQGPEILSPTQYRFKDTLGGTLLVDLNTNNFVFRRTFTPLPESPQDEILPNEQNMATLFSNYLEHKGLIKPGLEAGTFITLYDQGNNKDSQTAKVSLWPEPIDNLPIVTASTKSALINATVTKYQEENLRFTTIQYIYWPVDRQTLSTYALKPVSQAYSDLQQGLGIVVKNETQNSNASITNVYLAYYMPESYSTFLLPVYVFESDNFTAYVPALTADSYGQ